MYTRQAEKKLVGRYAANKFIMDGDNVALFEGSSALYVGLGIASTRERVLICTSNDPLVREARDNPAVGKRFRQFVVIGGVIDAPTHGGHGGVFGSFFEEQFTKAVTSDPGATVRGPGRGPGTEPDGRA